MDWGLIIGIIGVLFAAFVVPQWWSGEATRVRQAVRDAAPTLYFHVGSYGGAGDGYSITVENRGAASAFRGAVYLPGIDGTALQLQEIPPGFSKVLNIPLAVDAQPRTTRLPDAEAILVCEDRLGLEHKQTLALIQTPRADGRFNLGTPEASQYTGPSIGWRDIWRLRREA